MPFQANSAASKKKASERQQICYKEYSSQRNKNKGERPK
jgi:hypothetical protein